MTNLGKTDIFDQYQGVFVTGIYRSGTTFVEKILNSHPNILMASQPFPYLYFGWKDKFHKDLGLVRRYPLNDLFLENKYSNDQFVDYLCSTNVSDEVIQEWYENMQGYFGNWTPELQQFKKQILGGNLMDTYNSMCRQLARLFSKPEASHIGTKEIFGEEYIKYFLDSGVKVVHVIRDPRDVLASLSFGKGGIYGGANRPVLHTVRMWRQSVAFSAAFENHPNYTMVGFRNIIDDTHRVCNDVFRFLQLPELDEAHYQGEIKDQYGKPWLGNSSFEKKKGVAKNVIGGFKDKLPRSTVQYIEKIAGPEMSYLNLPLLCSESELSDFDIRRYKEPFEIDREEFSKGFSSNEENYTQEMERLRKLVNKEQVSDEELVKWFIHPKAFHKYCR